MTKRIKVEPVFLAQMADRMYDLLRRRGNVEHEDLEYLAERVDKLKDEKLKTIAAELIGWDDDERAEIETFVAISLEVMRNTNISKIRAAARIVELRHYAAMCNAEVLQ